MRCRVRESARHVTQRVPQRLSNPYCDRHCRLMLPGVESYCSAVESVLNRRYPATPEDAVPIPGGQWPQAQILSARHRSEAVSGVRSRFSARPMDDAGLALRRNSPLVLSSAQVLRAPMHVGLPQTDADFACGLREYVGEDQSRR